MYLHKGIGEKIQAAIDPACKISILTHPYLHVVTLLVHVYGGTHGENVTNISCCLLHFNLTIFCCVIYINGLNV